MTTRTRLLAACSIVTLFPLSGCLFISTGPVVWTDEVTEQVEIETEGLSRLEVRTHNGFVDYSGRAEGEAAAVVIVTKKAGGLTLSDAEAALDALDVYVESRGSGGKRIAWRWKTLRGTYWGARVSYEIDAPADLACELVTHNGPVHVSGVAAGAEVHTHNGAIDVKGCQGDVRLVSHNGPIGVESSGGRLDAETHNGRITADYEGLEVTLRTHNGRIEADVSRCEALRGKIVSHNGSLTLAVGDALSAELTCGSYNGRIRCDVPWQVREASRRRLTGRIGQGGPALTATTHNGAIHITPKG